MNQIIKSLFLEHLEVSAFTYDCFCNDKSNVDGLIVFSVVSQAKVLGFFCHISLKHTKI